ncbi:MAG: hypothetical protein ACR5K6_04895 [Wolbachia sp.]
MDFNQYVKGNALEISWTRVNVKELVGFLRSNIYITKLTLKIASINNEDARELAKLTHLTSLDLQNNNIGEKGVEALANGNLVHLAELNLKCNHIRYKSVEALANGNLTRLTKLDLRFNEIGDKGAEALADSNLARLIPLDLRWNRIDDKGVEGYILISLEKRRNRETEESSSSLSSSGSDSDQSDLSSELSEVQSISSNRLPRFSRSNDSDNSDSDRPQTSYRQAFSSSGLREAQPVPRSKFLSLLETAREERERKGSKIVILADHELTIVIS